MSEMDSVRLQLNEIEVRRSSVRQTPNTSFGETLKSGLRAGGAVVQSAGYAIPGAAVVGAAISGVGAVRDVSGGMANAPQGFGGSEGYVGVGSPASASATGSSYAGSGAGMSGGYMGAVAGRAAGGDQGSQMMMATQQMQEMNQSFNLQYLQLQQKMQADSRDFTAMSNIMKTKHDTARNALSNLK